MNLNPQSRKFRRMPTRIVLLSFCNAIPGIGFYVVLWYDDWSISVQASFRSVKALAAVRSQPSAFSKISGLH